MDSVTEAKQNLERAHVMRRLAIRQLAIATQRVESAEARLKQAEAAEQAGQLSCEPN